MLAVQNSQLLHDRCQDLLSRVAAGGGCVVFEQPPSSMALMSTGSQNWLARSVPFGAQVAACHHGLDVSKRWLFLSNQPSILDLASICQHPPPRTRTSGDDGLQTGRS